MVEKKKILFLITKGNFGGAQRYVFDLATNLPKTKFEIVVACGKSEGNLLIEKLNTENIRTIEMENSEREINFKKDFCVVKNILEIIKKEKPDIVHLNSSKIGLLGALAILFLKLSSIIHNSKFIIHSIFTSHGWAFNEEKRSFLSKIIFYIAHYITVLICDKTIAVSEKTKMDLDSLPFIEKKICVIHNGINGFKLLKKEEARNLFDKENTKKQIILTVAELHNNKGLDIAIKGISLLPEKIKEQIIYCIVGDGEEKETLEKQVKNLGLEKTVKFFGFVENAKSILSGADIFLFTSRTENLPFALLEAGFAKLPIISTSVGGIPEIIKDMRNGILIHPKNPKEVAEALIYMLEHKEKTKEFGSAIKDTVTNFFSLEKTLSETIKIYEN